MTSKTVMQVAVEAWEALKKVKDTAREVLPKDESKVVDEKVVDGAERTLLQLDEHRDRHVSPLSMPRRGDINADYDDETTEVRSLRQILEAQVSGD